MKVLVSVDIEGVAGVTHFDQTSPGNPEYERARRLMTAEASAAVEGALAGGATEVLVNDSHGHYRNMIPELLHPAAMLIQGKPRPLGMMAGIETGVDAVMMVGYHAGAHSSGILAHTMNGFAFSRVWIGEHDASEALIYGALAAEFGVPVVLISGDDVLVDEGRRLFPLAQAVEVKRATGCIAGTSLSPQEACRRLKEAAQRALAALPAASAAPPAPFGCRVQVRNSAMADLFSLLPFVERTDPVTVCFTAPSMLYTVRVLASLSAMAQSLR